MCFPEGSRRLVFVLATLIACFTAPALAAPVAIPPQLLLTVSDTAGIARSNEVVRSGVPVPRSLNLLGTSGLAVVDASGTKVPAELEVTGRWNAGKNNASAPIQWLLVTFPASVGANASAVYRVVTDGSAGPNPAPVRPLTLTQSGNAVTVDTGAATFRLGLNPDRLFDEVVLANGTRLIGGGSLTLRTRGTDYGHPATRRVWVEHQGPLTAIVVVQGAYDAPPSGGGVVSTRRRYVFTAGSPTAIVRHVANWEGNLADAGSTITAAGTPNGFPVERLRDDLAVELGGTPTVTAVGGFGSPAVTGAVDPSQSAWVRQQLRASRTAPLRFDVAVGGATATGAKADGGVLAASGPRGTVAIALNHMHRYEPQALRLLAGGHLAIDVADDKAWLANHQGLFATLAVTALPTAPARSDLDRLVWAPLNRPLHAWSAPEWFAASQAVDEFPVGTLPPDLAGYDTLVRSVLNRTMQQIDVVGLNGLMTFGLYPRYWGTPDGYNEVGCGANDDPTPGEASDDVFWCTAWTDYHNTVSTAPIWAMRTGEVEWLDEIGFPGALRTLHTQIMQCSPTERWFYCGQAPAGYGGYRTDFNSSHAYFENLYLYYWLTGDQTVIDILQRGGDSMRRWMCPQRGTGPVLQPSAPTGAACAPDYPITAENSVTGRAPQQWLAAFRFLGHASDDASFLDDFSSHLARGVTQLYADLVRNGVHYGFWGGPDPLTTPGTYTTDSQWTVGMYDMHYLNRLQLETGDAPLGVPTVKPSQVIANLAHTFKDIEPAVIGDGTVAGLWARLLQYTWTGSRLGGALTGVVGADRELYNPEKVGATALLIRAGQAESDAVPHRLRPPAHPLHHHLRHERAGAPGQARRAGHDAPPRCRGPAHAGRLDAHPAEPATSSPAAGGASRTDRADGPRDLHHQRPPLLDRRLQQRDLVPRRDADRHRRLPGGRHGGSERHQPPPLLAPGEDHLPVPGPRRQRRRFLRLLQRGAGDDAGHDPDPATASSLRHPAGGAHRAHRPLAGQRRRAVHLEGQLQQRGTFRGRTDVQRRLGARRDGGRQRHHRHRHGPQVERLLYLPGQGYERRRTGDDRRHGEHQHVVLIPL